MDEETLAMQGGGIDAIIAEFNTCARGRDGGTGTLVCLSLPFFT